MKSLRITVRKWLSPVQNEDGAALIFFGLMVVMLFGCFALAVDVGARLNSRSEAQRAADAGALAGAAMFWGVTNPGAYETAARTEALEFVGYNFVAGATAVADTVYVWPSERRVGVTVAADPGTLFARLIGLSSMPVSAYAEARVITATATKCVKPFMVPDLWSGAPANLAAEYPMTGAVPYYEQFNQSVGNGASATGYGSNVAPYGTALQLAITDPGGAPVPSIALAMEMVDDPDMAPCVDGTTSPDFRQNICSCNNNNFELGTPKPMLTSSTAQLGNTYNGFKTLYDADNEAYWDASTNQPVSPNYPDILDSPRVVKLALFDPEQLRDLEPGGNNFLTPNNVALFWLEWDGGPPGQYDSIQGRFLGFPGDGNLEGEAPGPNIQTLQLIR